MADITRAFENLNRSLRHISDSNRLEKQSQRQHQRSMAELKYKINDPRTKLLRAQVAEQMKLTEISIPIGTPTGLVDTIYSQALTNEFNSVLHKKGAELKNGKVMFRGTNEVYTEPAWQAKQTQRDLAILSTIGALPSNRKKVELAHLQQTEENFKSGTSGDMNPFQDRAREHNKAAIAKAQKDMTDPIEMHKTLRDNRIHLKRAYQEALGSRDNTIAKRIGDMLELNLKEEVAMGKTSKDQKAYNYSVLRDDGSTSTIKRYYYSGQPIPNMFKMNGETYKRGTQTKPFRESALGGRTDKDLINTEKIQRAVKRHTFLLSDREDIDLNISMDEYIKKFMRQKRGDAEEGKLRFEKLMETRDPEKMDFLDQEIFNLELNYENKSKFWLGRKKTHKSFLAKKKEYEKVHGKLKSPKQKLGGNSVGRDKNGLDRKLLGL